MKKNRIILSISLLGLTLFSSCLKDEPETTIFYGHQQIPNINAYMPMRLLEAFGNENLHFGDNPPQMEGNFLSVQRELHTFDTVHGSLWEPPVPTPQSDIFFNIFDQHLGVAQLDFTYTTDTVHNTTTQGTAEAMKSLLSAFVSDTIAPSYFKNGTEYSAADFGSIYIMGKDPLFTAYYYELRDTDEQPLYAVILSGKVASRQVIVQDTVNHTADTLQQTVLVDCKYGFEAMRYFGHFPNDLNLFHYPGDLVVYTCDTLKPIQSIEP